MTSGFLLLGEFLSLVFLAGVAKAALITGAIYVLFPELGALAYDVFTRPGGVWARAPVMLAVTPVAAAVFGTAIARSMPYGLGAAALSIASAMLLIRILRSPIAPAISAGFLPLALGVTSWWYPVSIAAVTGLLGLLSLIYRRVFSTRLRSTPRHPSDSVDDELESSPRRYAWLPVFVGFLLLAYGIATVTGNRLILFPPLVVIAFEMFAHADVCPWAKRPISLPLACTITAAVGVIAVLALGIGPLSVTVALLAGIAALRAFSLHLPPALAIGLLPQVIPDPGWGFVIGVAAGTLVLTGTFLFARPLLLGRPDVANAG
ncbi:HPP family protein [Burkholderia multivorans]|uniref:HPP family protein n=1 Tax=Burkholderia TaxID=32008 RepID=UPI001C248852|nr:MULTISPECIES: HPP family protein [Burkholderia]MBU9439348.1 HPP family protein [Burkholderia multivorans]MDD1489823.1 HPP family protein [Burkholderia thailandensis]